MHYLAKVWRKSLRKLFSATQSRPHRRTRPATRLCLEILETRLLPAPIITTIAGTGTANYNGDGLNANLALPHGLTLDASGNLFLADTANQRIRHINAIPGTVTTVARNDEGGCSPMNECRREQCSGAAD